MGAEQPSRVYPIYVSNNRALKYMMRKKTELKEEINNSTIITGDFNTQLSSKNRTTRQIIHTENRRLFHSIQIQPKSHL